MNTPYNYLSYEEIGMSMFPLIFKLYGELKREGIGGSELTKDENYYFIKGDKTLIISFHTMYGYSRISRIGFGEDSFEVTDEFYALTYLKSLILLYFKPKKPKL